MKLQASLLSLAFGLFVWGSSPALATPSPHQADHVLLTAWLEVAVGSTHDVIVEVEVNGTTDWGRPDQQGRVELQLPANEVALIHFRKAGHLTKSVKVDTHNLTQGTRQSIDFSVLLESDGDHPGLVYAGPVGNLSFSADLGQLAVETDTRLVPAGRQQSIVF